MRGLKFKGVMAILVVFMLGIAFVGPTPAQIAGKRAPAPAGGASNEGAAEAPVSQAVLWQQISNHMEYYGYKCAPKEKGARLYCATQKHYPNFTLKQQNGGLLMISYWTGTEYAKQNRCAFLNLVNTCNLIAIATRYYIDRDSDLALEVWIPGSYEKDSFGRAVENFNRDWDDVQKKFGQAILQYIR